MAPQPQVVTGEVGAVDERGGRVDGQWLNRSESAAVAAPEVGQTGALTIKGPRFISGLRVLTPGGPDEPEGAAVDGDPGTWGYARGVAALRPVAARPVPPAAVATPDPRSAARVTLKAAARAAAAHFHRARPEATVARFCWPAR